MIKNILFDDLHQWKVCFMAGCKEFWWGFARVISCLILGILSIIRWLWRLLVKAVSLYPVAAITISLMACFFSWLFTYTNYKAKLVSTQYERDSMAYRLKQFEQMYDGNTDSVIIVRNDSQDTLSFIQQYNPINNGF